MVVPIDTVLKLRRTPYSVLVQLAAEVIRSLAWCVAGESGTGDAAYVHCVCVCGGWPVGRGNS